MQPLFSTFHPPPQLSHIACVVPIALHTACVKNALQISAQTIFNADPSAIQIAQIFAYSLIMRT